MNSSRFDATLAGFAGTSMKIIPELDFAYFDPSWNDVDLEDSAKTAGAFIQKYASRPEVLAWSAAEETAPTNVARLAYYYSRIQAYAPGAKFQLILSNRNSAQNVTQPYPADLGADLYLHGWEFGSEEGGYFSTPSNALDWTRNEAALYHNESAKRGLPFSLVVTQGGLLMPSYSNDAINDSSNPTWQARYKTLAAEGRMGWRQFKDASGKIRYNAWKYYRAPYNLMRAFAWTSVLEGAKSFYVWKYQPLVPSTASINIFTLAQESLLRPEFLYWSLAGHPGKPNPELEDTSRAAKEIRARECVISRMTKLADLPVKPVDSRAPARAFSFPGVEGRIIVMMNSLIGAWPGANPDWPVDSDALFVDDEGKLMNYTPFSTARSVRFKVTTQERVYDLDSNTEIAADASGVRSVAIEPGSGKLFFVGSAAEAEKVHRCLRRQGCP
jgi:hypothetical protein